MEHSLPRNVNIISDHVPPRLYGLLFGSGVVGIMASNFVNLRLVTRLGSDRLLLWGTSTAAFGGTVLAVIAWTGWGGLLGLMVPLFLFVSAAGFIVGNSLAGFGSALCTRLFVTGEQFQA